MNSRLGGVVVSFTPPIQQAGVRLSPAVASQPVQLQQSAGNAHSLQARKIKPPTAASSLVPRYGVAHEIRR